MPLLTILLVPVLHLLQDSPIIIRFLLILWTTQSACFAIASVLRRSLALCEWGIVTNGAAFTPWHKLRSIGFSLDEHGNLVVGYGLWRVVAVVPPDEREAVEMLLKEKLGEKL